MAKFRRSVARRLVGLGVALIGLPACEPASRPPQPSRPPDVAELVSQLEGFSCRYSYRATCQVTDAWPWPFFRLEFRSSYTCPYAAASCLETLGEKAAP